MSLNFHIATSKELARQSPVEFSLDEESHAAMFNRLVLAEDAKLLKIARFSEGAQFSLQEITLLHRQLQRQLKEFNEKQVFTIIYTLSRLCEKAIGQNAPIFVFPVKEK